MAIRKKEIAEETENTELTLTNEGIKRHKKPRGSDAELEKELKARLLKVQEKMARQNEKIYFDLGFVLCQILDFDINTLTEEQREEITNKTDAGREFVKELIGK